MSGEAERKLRMATVWLDGCSGCHMSFLDQDERLLELASRIELVFSPLVDAKAFPEDVDVTLIEGAVATDEDLDKVRRIRERTTTLVAFGDCAVTGNVPAMRNAFEVEDVLARAYRENVDRDEAFPSVGLPKLLARSRPVHEVVRVDLHLPGCPPSADLIHQVILELLEGRIPDVTDRARFGA